jgi:hypothetical protein
MGARLGEWILSETGRGGECFGLMEEKERIDIRFG